jgi:hypothetical protein
MILSGILHSWLGGFTVISGVAPLGELARCSEFNAAYQRNLIETHRIDDEIFKVIDGSGLLVTVSPSATATSITKSVT